MHGHRAQSPYFEINHERWTNTLGEQEIRMHFLPRLQLDAKALLFERSYIRAVCGNDRYPTYQEDSEYHFCLEHREVLADALPRADRKWKERKRHVLLCERDDSENCCIACSCRHTIAFEPTLRLESVWVRIELRVPGARRLLTNIVTSTYVCSC
jgi:hypothetical protein